jgi:hypothetical protein
MLNKKLILFQNLKQTKTLKMMEIKTCEEQECWLQW